jgi:hypothetical protein
MHSYYLCFRGYDEKTVSLAKRFYWPFGNKEVHLKPTKQGREAYGISFCDIILFSTSSNNILLQIIIKVLLVNG